MTIKKAAAMLLAVSVLPATCACNEQNTDVPDIPDNNDIQNESTVDTVETDQNTFFLPNGLPDIGKYSSHEKFEYFDGVDPSVFKPSDNYGTLVPYIGKTVKFKAAEVSDEEAAMFGNLETAFYGLCTSDGRIVTDPIYSSITGSTSPDGFEYYILYQEQEVVLTENGEVDYSNLFMGMGGSIPTLIPSDGSWQINAPEGFAGSGYEMFGFSGISDGRIISRVDTVDDEGYIKPTFYIYDYDGKLVFSIEKDLGFDYLEMYSSGLARAVCYGHWDDEIDRNVGEHTDFYDTNGNLVFIENENIDNISSFNEYGVATAANENGLWGFIGTDGNWIMQPFLESLTEYQTLNAEGISFCGYTTEEGFDYFFYDDHGNELFKIENRPREISSVYGKYPDNVFLNDTIDLFTPDGKNVVTSTGDIDIDVEDDFMMIRHIKENSITVKDLDGNEICTVDNCAYYFYLGNGYIAFSVFNENSELSDDDPEKYTKVLTDMLLYNLYAGSTVAEEKYGGMAMLSPDGRFIELTSYTSGDYTQESLKIYDTSSGKFVFNDIGKYSCYRAGGKSYYAVCDENTYKLYDENMNIIVSKYNENII